MLPVRRESNNNNSRLLRGTNAPMATTTSPNKRKTISPYHKLVHQPKHRRNHRIGILPSLDSRWNNDCHFGTRPTILFSCRRCLRLRSRQACRCGQNQIGIHVPAGCQEETSKAASSTIAGTTATATTNAGTKTPTTPGTNQSQH